MKGIICNMCDFYKVEVVSRIFKVSPVTIRRWCRLSRIKSKKIGKCWFIPKDELLLFEDVRKKSSPSDKKR